MLNSFLKAQLFFLIPLTLLFFILAQGDFKAVLFGFGLSFFFIASSIWIIQRFWNAGEKTFFRAFMISLPIRFVLVLIAFAILVSSTKIDEIYFTVSFIISYLCHSITEMIFINKFLKKRST